MCCFGGSVQLIDIDRGGPRIDQNFYSHSLSMMDEVKRPEGPPARNQGS